MQVTKSIELKSAIITLKQIEDGNLIVMDQEGNLRYINVCKYKTVAGFKTNIKQERSWGNHMSVSSSGRYAACVIPHNAKAAVYDVQNKKLLYTISGHKGDLESICVDDNNHYLVTGGTDGRTYVNNIETKRLVYAFPPHADYITALDINSIWVVSASYDKSISVLNLSTMKTPTKLSGHSAVIVQMKLLKNMRMISADKEGNILLWNLKTSELLHRFKKMNDDVTCLSISGDEKFLFVGSKLGYVSAYDVEEGTLLKQSYIKEKSKICSLCILDESKQIVVGTKLGALNFYSLLGDEKSLIGHLKNKDYAKIYEAAEKNPLLKYSSVYAQYRSLWKSAFSKATKMLEQDQKNNAEVILEPFREIRSKAVRIQNLFLDYKEFNKFKRYVSEKKYSLAYPLAGRHQHFKESAPYKVMENEWHSLFNKAKVYIKNKEGDERVRRLLHDFKGISEKSVLIQELFRQRTAYMLFQKKLAQKDYVAIFSLLQKCPFIKEFDEYDKLLEYGDLTFIKVQKALQNQDYEKVVEHSSKLLAFPDFKEEANEMIQNAQVMSKFTKAYDNNNLALMYEMIGEFPFLIELDEAKVLEEDWHEHLILAEKFASKADVVNVVASLEDFFEIKAKHLSIALVVQQAYLSQLYRALRSKKPQALIENAVKQYLVFFGKDEYIEDFVENFLKEYASVISIDKYQKGDIKLFKPFMIIPEIII